MLIVSDVYMMVGHSLLHLVHQIHIKSIQVDILLCGFQRKRGKTKTGRGIGQEQNHEVRHSWAYSEISMAVCFDCGNNAGVFSISPKRM